MKNEQCKKSIFMVSKIKAKKGLSWKCHTQKMCTCVTTWMASIISHISFTSFTFTEVSSVSLDVTRPCCLVLNDRYLFLMKR
ncbi:hypothetical protein X975_20600, partial [Stegodyphus mimosarum]